MILTTFKQNSGKILGGAPAPPATAAAPRTRSQAPWMVPTGMHSSPPRVGGAACPTSNRGSVEHSTRRGHAPWRCITGSRPPGCAPGIDQNPATCRLSRVQSLRAPAWAAKPNEKSGTTGYSSMPQLFQASRPHARVVSFGLAAHAGASPRGSRWRARG